MFFFTAHWRQGWASFFPFFILLRFIQLKKVITRLSKPNNIFNNEKLKLTMPSHIWRKLVLVSSNLFKLTIIKCKRSPRSYAILAKIRLINTEEHGTKVESVRYIPFNLVGQDSTKSVHSTVSSLFQSTAKRH